VDSQSTAGPVTRVVTIEWCGRRRYGTAVRPRGCAAVGWPAERARVCRQRIYESDKTIVNILERLAVGAALNQATTEEVIEQLKKLEAERHLELADLHFDLDSVELRIDEQPGPLTIERLKEH